MRKKRRSKGKERRGKAGGREGQKDVENEMKNKYKEKESKERIEGKEEGEEEVEEEEKNEEKEEKKAKRRKEEKDFNQFKYLKSLLIPPINPTKYFCCFCSSPSATSRYCKIEWCSLGKCVIYIYIKLILINKRLINLKRHAHYNVLL